MICDAHCHLDLMDNMPVFIANMRRSSLTMLAVGTTPKAYLKEVQFCQENENIHVGLGFHPQLIDSKYADFSLFLKLAHQSHYIGEVGLDFSEEYKHTKDLQTTAFANIVRACEETGEKVVSIHSRKSATKVIDILEYFNGNRSNRYILHWFTGSVAQARRAVSLGCYFSINPRMLKTKSGMEIIRSIPCEKMLLETDAPFGVKAQLPQLIEKELRLAALQLSNLTGRNMEQLIESTAKNIFSYR